jgi:serine acetyltransferase
MIKELLHNMLQYCHRYNLKLEEKIFDKLKMLICSADIPERTKIHPTVSFAYGGMGVMINPSPQIGEYCIINTKVYLSKCRGPKLGKYVYVGSRNFCDENIEIADYVIVGVNSIVVQNLFYNLV